MISFNKPMIVGNELKYIAQSLQNRKLSGNGYFTQKCHSFFEEKYGFKKVLLTTSCTDALEMAAILCDVKVGDEVIVPSYTFVSSALAFVRQGAKIVFADSYTDNPNIDPNKLEGLITEKTKVIVPVHYAGVACDMDAIMRIADKYNLLVVEDAAQAIDSYYKGKPLGGLGHISAFSFHETKNIVSGEGGMLVINDDRFIRRSEIIWEKGTNRSEFFRGEVNKYGWVDTGSSFLPSELIAAFLFAQLEKIDLIQKRRIEIWNRYYDKLKPLSYKGFLKLPSCPNYATNNGHMFYLLCKTLDERTNLIQFLKKRDISAPFHYLSLHKSDFYTTNYTDIPNLPNCDFFADSLVRLPMCYELSNSDIDRVVESIREFFES